MQVNTNTLLRGLRLLRDEGLLELCQGHGIRVTDTPARSAVLAKITELVQLGRRNGYTRVELACMIESVHVALPAPSRRVLLIAFATARAMP